ncbi:MAG: type II toxin-antitoxin system PemK/MazF family toxin [Acidobacteria bacterium]|nr:type II toxin-antitoxin system PemK/MazF family toxin [Acidobacteriota bacterium]
MPNSSRSDIVLVRYPFSNLSGAKVRPAVVVNAPHISRDIIIVPLTSRLTGLLSGEFVLQQWQQAGLNVPSAIKRGIYTVEESLIVKTVGQLNQIDEQALEMSLRGWLGL